MLNFCCVILLYMRVVLGQTLCLGEQWCTIVDELEVYEYREAEGQKSSMDYSEFFISTKKNPDIFQAPDCLKLDYNEEGCICTYIF